MRLSRLAGNILVLLMLGSGLWASAQEPPAPAPPAAEAAKPSSDTLREQTIYIPYGKLREVFEKQGRGVFLPYEKFQELWRLAQEKAVPEAEPQPPLGAAITAIENEAMVEKDVFVVTARLRIDLLRPGWHYIPLGLRDAALRSARQGEEAARVTFAPEHGYRLLLEHRDDAPAQREITLEYAKAITRAPGQNSVAFEAPQAPVNRWRIRIPQTGAKVNLHPFLAATEMPAEAPPEAVEPPEAAAPGETVLLAFVGAAPQVRIEWTPKTEGAAGLEALATVQTRQEVTLDEGVLRVRAQLTFEIRRAELAELKLELPANFKVVGVFDANVRQWSTGTEGDVQTLQVSLFDPAKATQQLIIEMERLDEMLLQEEIRVPVVKAPQAGQQQGLILIHVAGELRAEPVRRVGVLQVDVQEVAPMAPRPPAFAFRYAAVPFDLTLKAEKVQPRIRVDELVEIYLQPDQLVVDWLGVFEIDRAGVFQFEVQLPPGYEIRQVQGREVAGAQAVVVDTYQPSGGDPPTLRINCGRKAEGRVALWIELQHRLDDPNLVRPTGAASTLPLHWPRLASGSVERETGRVLVYAPESLRLNPVQFENVRQISFQEALQGMASLRDGRFPETREILAFAYADMATNVSLSVERRRPQITARQLLVARVESGVVKYEALFTLDVLYSGVKSFRIDVPQALAQEIRNRSANIREKPLEPQPDDVAEGYVAWGFTGETEFLGSVQVRLTWEQKLDELDVGQSVPVAVPSLLPREVDRSWGQIVLTKAETLDVQPTSTHSGLRPIDPQQDLMPNAGVPDAALAFEFHEDWELTVAVTRFELEDVKHTSIERAVLRMVVTRSDQVAVQALYRMRSAHQRLGVQLPADVEFDNEPLRINGRPVPLERGEQGEYFLPLTGQAPDQSFVLELRYSVTGTFRELEFPTFRRDETDDTAVQKVFLCVYLPDELALLGARGPWDDELSTDGGEPSPSFARWFTQLGEPASPPYHDAELVRWVTEGIDVAADPHSSFPTDGSLYVFSALRPAPPPQGSLRLAAMQGQILNVLLFGSLAVIGLVFLRRSVVVKVVVLLAIFLALVLVGVFLPTLAIQVLDSKLLVAVVALAIVWAVVSLLSIWHRRPAPPAPPPGSVSSPEPEPAAPGGTAAAAGSPFATPPDREETPAAPLREDPSKTDEGGPRHE